MTEFYTVQLTTRAFLCFFEHSYTLNALLSKEPPSNIDSRGYAGVHGLYLAS